MILRGDILELQLFPTRAAHPFAASASGDACSFARRRT